MLSVDVDDSKLSAWWQQFSAVLHLARELSELSCHDDGVYSEPLISYTYKRVESLTNTCNSC